MCLEALAQLAAADPDVRLLVLFGSRARGGGRPASDFDLGVSLTHSAARSRVEAALGGAVEREVDVVDLDTAPPQLRFEIARDGRLLFERRPYLWADFRARAMIDWWDWAPISRRIHAAAVERLRAHEHGPA